MQPLHKCDPLPLSIVANEWARELDERQVAGRPAAGDIILQVLRALFADAFPEGGAAFQRGYRFNQAEIEAKEREEKRSSKEAAHDAEPETRVPLQPLPPELWPFTSDFAKAAFRRAPVDRITREAAGERIFLYREAFGRWCDREGWERPGFWFPVIPPTKQRKSMSDRHREWLEAAQVEWKAGRRNISDIARKIAKQNNKEGNQKRVSAGTVRRKLIGHKAEWQIES